MMVVVMMSSGTADHFHAGSHFHAALRRSSGCDMLQTGKKPKLIIFQNIGHI